MLSISFNHLSYSILNMSKVRIHITVTFLIMVFIFFQSALPGDLSGAESNFIVELITRILDTDAETVSFIVRKLAHFTEYLILGIFLALDAQDIAVMRQRETGFAYIWFIPFLTGMLYAATDEFHQSFVPGRSCELRDVMIDSAGVAAGVLILTLMRRGR